MEYVVTIGAEGMALAKTVGGDVRALQHEHVVRVRWPSSARDRVRWIEIRV